MIGEQRPNRLAAEARAVRIDCLGELLEPVDRAAARVVRHEDRLDLVVLGRVHQLRPQAVISRRAGIGPDAPGAAERPLHRSEEHTSELQSLMRNSYAVFCLKKKKTQKNNTDKQL